MLIVGILTIGQIIHESTHYFQKRNLDGFEFNEICAV